MATVKEARLLEIITDAGESAKNMARAGLQRLLALCDAGKVQIVIIAKLDRLTRSVRDLADLLERFERRGVTLVSVADALDTKTAAGKLVLNIMTSVSQWEREAIGERTRDVLRHKRVNRMVYCRKTPYGFERDGERLLPLQSEQTVIERIKLWRADGRTLRQIADTLNREGVSTKLGASWIARSVKDVLDNPLHQAA